MRGIALVVIAGCSRNLDDIRGGSLGASLTAGDATTHGAVAGALNLRNGTRFATEIGGGHYVTEDGAHVVGGSFAETFGLNLTTLLPELSRWLEAGPEAGLGFIVFRSDDTTPVAGVAYAGGWIDLHVGALDNDVPGVHIETRRELRSELANENVFLIGLTWH